MTLDQQIKDFYFDHIDELPLDKQFHFATRLAAWFGDPAAYSRLEQLKSYILPDEYSSNLGDLIKEVLATPQTGRRNAHQLRQPFFDKYSELYGLHLALFRVRHLKYVYGIDAADVLADTFGKEKMEGLLSQLASDSDALRILSTFAVNTIYLHDLLFGTSIAEPELFLNVAKQYSLKNKLHIQLLIYLYTHCIIGESNFYTNNIPDEKKRVYSTMLEQLEKVIIANFSSINLDNKLEFLVCARICDYKTSLDEKIFAECATSLSPNGTFLIDVHNQNMQLDRQTFDKSEHRNVLFIMARHEYRPRSTLV